MIQGLIGDIEPYTRISSDLLKNHYFQPSKRELPMWNEKGEPRVEEHVSAHEMCTCTRAHTCRVNSVSFKSNTENPISCKTKDF